MWPVIEMCTGKSLAQFTGFENTHRSPVQVVCDIFRPHCQKCCFDYNVLSVFDQEVVTKFALLLENNHHSIILLLNVAIQI